MKIYVEDITENAYGRQIENLKDAIEAEVECLEDDVLVRSLSHADVVVVSALDRVVEYHNKFQAVIIFVAVCINCCRSTVSIPYAFKPNSDMLSNLSTLQGKIDRLRVRY